jgi:hypothetical protein
MNREQWRVYNREKQRIYREIKRGCPARPYVKIEEIMKAAGHCGFCGMLLTSEYHQKHPLIGCQKFMGRGLGSSDSPKV